MLNVTRGLAQVLSDVKPIYFEGTPAFYAAVHGQVGPRHPQRRVRHVRRPPSSPRSCSTKTILGRYTFALGSNEEATRLSGVNVDRWKIAVYAVGGLFAGLAGILIAARMNSAQPSVGMGYELDAIAAAVIGGTSLSGGEGSIVGTIIGAFIISTLTHRPVHRRRSRPVEARDHGPRGHRRRLARHPAPARSRLRGPAPSPNPDPTPAAQRPGGNGIRSATLTEEELMEYKPRGWLDRPGEWRASLAAPRCRLRPPAAAARQPRRAGGSA